MVSLTQDGQNKEFVRHAFYLVDGDQKNVLVHYIGDESTASEFPHGNAKTRHNFYRTCPSVLRKMSSEHDAPGTVYKSYVSGSVCPVKYQPSLVPRNSKQVINLQYKERQMTRLSHDALYNMHEMAYDLDGFVKKITTYPDLIVICGISRVADELDALIQIETDLPQLLSYDTTFQLGDFYLSPFLFRHTIFDQSPVVPALFLIHERKFQHVHEELMRTLAAMIPNLVKGKCRVPIVTDDEVGISQAIGKYLPNLQHVNCWNHTINAIKVWLRNHGATAAEIPAYISYVRELLNQPDSTSYEEKLDLFCGNWSQPFYEYYMEYVHPKVN